MKILLVAATAGEVQELQEDLHQQSMNVEVLITGIGAAATAYSLTRKLCKNRYDLVMNIGLAGSFRDEIQTGEVVNVVSETFGDLGAEDDRRFISAFELGLMKEDEFPFWNGKLKSEYATHFPSLSKLKKVKGVTVNTVHGNEYSILRTVQKYQPDIESMEGAAVFYVCQMEKTPFLQLRAISNRVEKRNRNAWNIPLPLENLRRVVLLLLNELEVKEHG
jgi:futalosine hydrolase